jgi:hypothetical protein
MKRSLLATLAVIFLPLAFLFPGCSDQQIAKYQQELNTAQVAIDTAHNATTQASAVVDQAEAVVATQPSNTEAQKVLASARDALARVQQVEAQAQSALTLANQVGDAVSGKSSTVDVSPLSAFGPYGTLAGYVILGGLAFYKEIKNSGLIDQLHQSNQQVADHQVTIATMQASAPAAVVQPPAIIPTPA